MPKIHCKIHGLVFGVEMCEHLISDIDNNDISEIEYKKVSEDEWDVYFICQNCFDTLKVEKEDVLNKIKVKCIECAKLKMPNL